MDEIRKQRLIADLERNATYLHAKFCCNSEHDIICAFRDKRNLPPLICESPETDYTEFTINLRTHKIEGWKPEYGDWHIFTKTIDTGTYTILGADKNIICRISHDYVPNNIIPPSDGYGDYIEFGIDKNGFAHGWNNDYDFEQLTVRSVSLAEDFTPITSLQNIEGLLLKLCFPVMSNLVKNLHDLMNPKDWISRHIDVHQQTGKARSRFQIYIRGEYGTWGFDDEREYTEMVKRATDDFTLARKVILTLYWRNDIVVDLEKFYFFEQSFTIYIREEDFKIALSGQVFPYSDICPKLAGSIAKQFEEVVRDRFADSKNGYWA